MKKLWTAFAFMWLIAFFVGAFTFALMGDKIMINNEWRTIFIILASSGMLIGLFGSCLSKKEIKQY